MAKMVASSKINQLREFYSADSFIESELSGDFDWLFPEDFLNSLAVSGFPPHKLTLALGSPIMLLRNLRPKQGLCNGTRLICTAFQQHVIEAEIITGTHTGERVFIPRVVLYADDLDLPITLKRVQFPVTPAFAMTINKLQGQALGTTRQYDPKYSLQRNT